MIAPEIIRVLRSEFFTSVPRNTLEGCSSEVIEKAVSAYVDIRLSWEASNRGAYDIGWLASFITAPLGIGRFGMRKLEEALKKNRYDALAAVESILVRAHQKNG